MKDGEYGRQLAERCRRLAFATTDSGVSERLVWLAEELLAKAREHDPPKHDGKSR